MKDIFTAIEDIKNNGYTILKKYLNQENVAVCQEKVNNLYEEISKDNLYSSKAAPKGLQNTIRDDFIVNSLVHYDKYFVDLSTTGDHLKILGHFLNDPYYGLVDAKEPNFILAQMNARAGMTALPFHIDTRLVTPGYQTWSMQGLLALEKLDKTNGCLRLIPKTHVVDFFPDSKKDYSEAVDIELEKGDLIIFSSKVHHATHKNELKQRAWTILLTYRSWWCKPQFDFLKLVPKEIYSNLNNNQKLMLGACSQPSYSIDGSASARSGYEIL
jgi:ectoine hydroxylase-related dioxygenase (phytanoyl-CoA dioxygenase family)